jgi:hypothetical protein
MIDLTSSALERNGKVKAISEWVVWFMTPFGIAATSKDAIELCQKRDIDPEINITPIPVAMASDGDYEMFIPRR